jgi:hypothetical protein
MTFESETANNIGIGFVIGADLSLITSSLLKIRNTSPSAITGRCISLSQFDEMLPNCEFLELISSSSPTSSITPANISHELGSLFLGGHSDGVCHKIGNFAICTQDEMERSFEGLNCLPCFLGDSCKYKINSKTTVSRINASSISSQLIVDLTCHGFLLDSDVLDCKHGHARAFLMNPCTQALITTMSVVLVDKSDYLRLFCLAHDGVPVGIITSLANRHYKELMRNVPLFVYGDPRIRLHPQTQAHSLHACPGSFCSAVKPSTLYSTDYVLEQDHVLLFMNIVDAVYCLNNRLYFFTKPSCDQPVISTVSLDRLRSITSFEQLSPSLAFAEQFIIHLVSLTANQDSRLVQLKRKSILKISNLQQFILKHNSAMVRGRRAVDLDQLSLLFSEFYGLMVDVVDDLVSSSLCALEEGCNVGLHINDYFCHSGVEEGRSCFHCGSDIISLKQSLVGLQYTRLSSFCYSCGPLHSGNALIGPLFLHQSEDIISVEFCVRNSTSLRLPARGLAWLQAWGDLKSKATLMNEIDLPADETITFSMNIEIPTSFQGGAMRIFVLLFLGPQIELLSRRMPIDVSMCLQGIDSKH